MIEVLINETGFKFKGMLIGHISNGGGILPLENGFALKFISNEKFCNIQLIHQGNGKPVSHQTWQKTKTQIVKEQRKNFEVKEREGQVKLL